MSGSDDSVNFPVTDATFAGHDRGPLVNASAIGDLHPAGVTAITFALLLLTSQMLIERAPATFVCIDIEIDAFMTNRGLLLQLQTSSDLFRAPLLPQQHLNLAPGLWSDARWMRPVTPASS